MRTDINTSLPTGIHFSQAFLRLAAGVGYIVPSLDRLGVWGPPGGHNISWGDWAHFFSYARQLLFFMPTGMATVSAAVATALELLFGLLLLLGWKTRWVAVGSGLLSLTFALCMAIAFGIVSPLSYSVFTLSAASFLLASIPFYKWSLDAYFSR